jgi:serine/threonine protein kinase
MATTRKEWENIRQLGFGGQGKVYLVRTPSRSEERVEAAKRIRDTFHSAGGGLGVIATNSMAEDIFLCGRSERCSEIAALKEFEVGGIDKEQAIKRLEAEIKALSTIQYPSILKYVDASVDERFLVSQFYPNGSLHGQATAFKGDPIRALKAFRSLVEAVKLIHDNGAIHRDIKPENIFLSATGDLVLGDFGIVIFRDSDRLTATYERAGTRYWMAPWVDRKERIELAKVDATLDIYPLGKLLWFLIAGRDIFSREEFDDTEYNLEVLFPDQAFAMRKVNALLRKCVVAKRNLCLGKADDLLSEIRKLESTLSGPGCREPDAQSWPCRVCGRGEYEVRLVKTDSGSAEVPLTVQVYKQGFGVAHEHRIQMYFCNNCGHVELFIS